VIEPALARGVTVVCDRYTDASFAYQGGGRGLSLTVLGQLEAWVQQGLQPDLTLLFELPPGVAASRLTAARQPDRFESQDEAFFDRVSVAYAQRVMAAPTRFARLDAERPRAAVWQQIQTALQDRGWW
jgi:dTMP kinase